MEEKHEIAPVRDLVVTPPPNEPPFFRVNGVNILPLVKEGGMKWSRNDVDSPSSGRTMDAVMHRSRVAIKWRADFEIMDLPTNVCNALLNLILPVFVEVETNQHPLYGYYAGQYYSNNVPATAVYIDKKTGNARWTGISFPLIER